MQKIVVFQSRFCGSKMARSSSWLGRKIFILEIRGSSPLRATKNFKREYGKS